MCRCILMLASGAACPAILYFDMEPTSSFKFHCSLHFAFLDHESPTIDVTEYVGYESQRFLMCFWSHLQKMMKVDHLMIYQQEGKLVWSSLNPLCISCLHQSPTNIFLWQPSSSRHYGLGSCNTTTTVVLFHWVVLRSMAVVNLNPHS